MSFKINGFRSRAVKRIQLSRNQVAAKERLRLEWIARRDDRLDREIADAREWERNNPARKLPPASRIRIEIPGLPVKTITVRRWQDGSILAGNRITTAKAFGRKLGTLLDQFLP